MLVDLKNPVNNNNVIITLAGGEQKNTLGELLICSRNTRGKIISLNEYLTSHDVSSDKGIMLVISTSDVIEFIDIQKIYSIKFNRFLDEKNHGGLEI